MNQAELNEIIHQHLLWLESEGQSGERADFSQSTLNEKFGEPIGESSVVIFHEGGGLAAQAGGTAFVNGQKAGHPNHFNNLSIEGKNLSNAIFGDAVFYNCSFAKTTLHGCDLSNVKMGKVNLSGAMFGGFLGVPGANLSGITLYHSNADRIFLQHFDLSNAKLCSSSLKGASLFNAKIDNAQLMGVNFTDASLMGASAKNASAAGAIFNGANLSHTDLSGSNLSRANLIKANLESSNLENARLQLSDLSDANITNAKWHPLSYWSRINACIKSLCKSTPPAKIAQGCRISSATGNESLKRAILDESFIEERCHSAPIKTLIWTALSNCGRSLAIWGIVVTLIFATFTAIHFYLGDANFKYPDELKNTNWASQLLVAAYYSVVTITTLGYGDITPTTPIGMLVVILQAILGVLIMGVTTAMLISRIMHEP